MYGFAGEGDWKTAALVCAMKVMGTGLPGANSFMEDYSYHFDPANPMVLGSHMLEVDEALAEGEISEVKLIIVIPERLNKVVEKRLAELGVETFSYSWRNDIPHFPELENLIAE